MVIVEKRRSFRSHISFKFDVDDKLMKEKIAEYKKIFEEYGDVRIRTHINPFSETNYFDKRLIHYHIEGDIEEERIDGFIKYLEEKDFRPHIYIVFV